MEPGPVSGFTCEDVGSVAGELPDLCENDGGVRVELVPGDGREDAQAEQRVVVEGAAVLRHQSTST